MLQRLLVNLEWSWILCFRVFVVVRAWFLPRCQSGTILTLCLKVVFPESSSTFSLTQFCSCEQFESLMLWVPPEMLTSFWNLWFNITAWHLNLAHCVECEMFHLEISMRWLLSLRWPGTLCRRAMKLPTCVEAVGSFSLQSQWFVKSLLHWVGQCSLAESAIQIDKFLFVGLERVILEL